MSVFFFKQKTAYEIRLSLVGSERCIRDSLITYDHAAGAGAKFKGVARSSIALTELDNDLSDSYLMLIEAPTVGKTYTIDGRVATARTVTNYYAKTSRGTCTAVLTIPHIPN